MNEQPFDSLVRDAFQGENDSPLPANPTWLDAQGHISLNRVPTGIRRGWNESELTHLEQCPSCTWRLALAFRQQCPSPAMLIAYMSGVMHAVERKAIAVHIERDMCQRCADTLQILHSGWQPAGAQLAGSCFFDGQADSVKMAWKSKLPANVTVYLHKVESGKMICQINATSRLAKWLVQVVCFVNGALRSWTAPMVILDSGSSCSIELGNPKVVGAAATEGLTLAISLSSGIPGQEGCLDPIRVDRYAFEPSAMDRFEKAHVDGCGQCRVKLAEARGAGTPDAFQIAQTALGHASAEDDAAVNAWFTRIRSSSIRETAFAAARRSWESAARMASNFAEAVTDLRATAWSVGHVAEFKFASETGRVFKLAEAAKDSLNIRLDSTGSELFLAVTIDDPLTLFRRVHVEIARGKEVIVREIHLQRADSGWKGAATLDSTEEWESSESEPIVISAIPIADPETPTTQP